MGVEAQTDSSLAPEAFVQVDTQTKVPPREKMRSAQPTPRTAPWVTRMTCKVQEKD